MKQSPIFIFAFLIITSFIIILSCDFNKNYLYNSKEYKIQNNTLKQGKFYTNALSSTQLTSNYPIDSNVNLKEMQTWQLTKDISHYPTFESDNYILNAIYNMSLEELVLSINNDSLFNTSDEKKGIGTRDISYSVILALAITNPEISKKSLMCRVISNKITQDSGSNGAWPINSDRMMWSVAAYEIYKTTGDKLWLKKAYKIIKNTIKDDLNVIWNYHEHLFKGESSFLNQKKQTYPQWMDAKDIFSSYALSTQAIHYQSLIVLSKMGDILNYDTQKYKHISYALKKSINKKFWLKDKKHYAQFKYDSYSYKLSEKTDNLGQSLCILFDIADDKQKKQIINNTVQLPFGITCFYPQTPDESAYHNNTIEPLVQAYWTWASAKTNNNESVKHGLASLIRSPALFLTNKENILAETGDFRGITNNSNRHIASVSATLSGIYRVLFGLNFKVDHLQISPFIPREFNGELNLKNFKYRNSNLDIKILGFGNQIRSFFIDSIPINENEISGLLKGYHKIFIQMTNGLSYRSKIKLKQNSYSPQTPLAKQIDSILVWQQNKNDKKYRIFRNHKMIFETSDTSYQIPSLSSNSSYQIEVIDKSKNKSFLSKAILTENKDSIQILEAEWFTNQKNNYIELNNKNNLNFTFKIKIKEAGSYFIDFWYANGNNSTKDEQCITRSLWVSHDYLGTIVFPQRGYNNWNSWGFSNAIKINVEKGITNLRLKLEPFNKTSNIKNTIVHIDKIRIRKTTKLVK